MISFVTLTFLNTNNFGIFVSSLALLYFALRIVLNPKMRVSVDILALVLLVGFIYYVSVQVLVVLGL
jgi:hypothetical protein